MAKLREQFNEPATETALNLFLKSELQAQKDRESYFYEKMDSAIISWRTSDDNMVDLLRQIPSQYRDAEAADFITTKGPITLNSEYSGDYACSLILKQHNKSIKELLSMGLDIGKMRGDLTLIHAAVSAENHEAMNDIILYTEVNKAAGISELTVKELVNLKDKDDKTPLLYAAYTNDIEATIELLVLGADVNAKTNEGITPLMVAATKANAPLTKKLLDAGADMYVETEDGKTAFDLAIVDLADDNIRVFLDAGYDFDRIGTSGKPFLFSAISKEYTEPTFKKIFDIGASVFFEDKNCRTLIHEAASNDRHSFIKLLADEGVDVNAKSKSGHTAIEEAYVLGYKDTVAELLKCGAKMPKKITPPVPEKNAKATKALTKRFQ